TNEFSRPFTFAMRWDGARWSNVPTQNKPAPFGSRFDGVSCASTTKCFAVGSVEDANTAPSAKTLIERWNGTAFTIVPSPNSAAAPADRLVEVSCPSATSCYAVGEVGDHARTSTTTLVERWNGT